MAIATSNLRRAYRAVTVTLATANQNYGLADLLVAIDSDVAQYTHELVLQSDPGNAGAKVFIGDKNLSASRLGISMGAGDSRTYVARKQGIDLTGIYLRSDTNNALVNVEIVDF